MRSPDVPPMMRELEKRWNDKIKTKFMFESFQGWDALWSLTQAIEAAQSFEPTKVKSAWENIKSVETCYGTGHMGGLKTYGINHLVVRRQPISALENGNVKLIKWYVPKVP